MTILIGEQAIQYQNEIKEVKGGFYNRDGFKRGIYKDDNNRFVAFDNRDGNNWIEDFSNEIDAIQWLFGEEEVVISDERFFTEGFCINDGCIYIEKEEVLDVWLALNQMDKEQAYQDEIYYHSEWEDDEEE